MTAHSFPRFITRMGIFAGITFNSGIFISSTAQAKNPGDRPTPLNVEKNESRALAPQFWMRVRAKDKYERSQIADLGVAIETVNPEDVIVFGNQKQKQQLQNMGLLDISFAYTGTADFPPEDSKFHTYDQLVSDLKELASKNPELATLTSLGKSLQGRDLWNLTLTAAKPSPGLATPGVLFLGTHHAREHVSTEVPLLLAKYLVDQYNQGDTRIQKLLRSREVYIVPLVNPDGAEYDIDGGKYHMWRKNLAARNGEVYGVDLNRNYGFQWGGAGAGTSTSDETYRGPSAFSEPETKAVKAFIDQHSNISNLLTFHTFSMLILYPWGHTYSAVSDSRDHQVFETMAKKMATWNSYTPQQSSALYKASGDTTDWAYGAHKIFAFTFELDPSSMFDGGFYPGQDVIQPVFQKNIEPCLYLIDTADDPYRVLNPNLAYGLNSGLLN